MKNQEKKLSQMIWDGDVSLEPMLWRVDEATEAFARQYRAENGRKLDANETNFVARSLLYVKAQVQEVKYSKLVTRMAFPMAPAGGAGLESIATQTLDYTGEMKLIGSGATDSPEAGASLSESIIPIGKYGCHYKWTHQDLEAAMRAGVPLSSRKAIAARFASEQKVENVALFGDTINTNIKGLFSNTLTAVTAGVTGTWSTATDAQILRDVELLYEGTLAAHSDALPDPDAMFFPANQKGRMKRTRTNTDWSIEKAIKENLGINEINYSARLNSFTNSTNSISAQSAAVCYIKDPMIAQMELMRDFQQLPVERRGLEYRVECLLDFGGFNVFHPLAFGFIKGL